MTAMYSENDILRNEKYSIKNGIASTIVLNISNNYFTLFAIGVLGASNYQVGLINSLPQFIGMFAMVICSFLMNGLAEKKRFTGYSILFTRLFLLLMFLVLYIPSEYRNWTFVILVGLMNFPGSFANLSWQSFIGDLVPDNRRSGFFSDRNRVLTIVGMITTFIVGIGLQLFDKANSMPYKILFLAAFIFGAVEVYYLNKHTEPVRKVKKENKKEFKLLDWNAFKDKRFVYFLICSLFFNFAWQMAWSLFSIYQIKDAHATGLWISLFNVANQVAQIVSFRWWGKMADKHSNSKMLFYCALGMATAPVLNILSDNLIYLVIVNASSGLFVSGTVLLLFNQLLEVTNEQNRGTYIANYNILLAIVGFIAPQFGVFLLETNSMDFAMTISSLLRTLSAIPFYFLFHYMKKNGLQKPKPVTDF